VTKARTGLRSWMKVPQIFEATKRFTAKRVPSESLIFERIKIKLET